MTRHRTRRSLLAGVACASTGLAGCFTVEEGQEERDGEVSDGDDAAMAADDGTRDDATQRGDETQGDDGTQDDDGTQGDDGTQDDDGSPESDGEDAAGDDAADEELDLREANVTDVEVEAAGDGAYEVSVTLYHDDDGEDGYANWWQVETRDGERLGRRDLLHAHSTEPFTRSETIDVPAGVDCVVVRGHDQTHAYGGQAMLVSLPDGATEAVEQGSDPDDLDGAACP